jgi:hypothetical protein
METYQNGGVDTFLLKAINYYTELVGQLFVCYMSLEDDRFENNNYLEYSEYYANLVLRIEEWLNE